MSPLSPDFIKAAIDALPPREREAIEATYYERASIRDIAKRWAIEDGKPYIDTHKVWNTIQRALGHLKEDLECLV